MLTKQISVIDRKVIDSTKDFNKTITIGYTRVMLKMAWRKVGVEKIKNCWHHALSRADIYDSSDINAAIVPTGEDETSRDDLCQALQISNQNLRDHLEENEDDTFEELTNENILMMVNDSKCASEGMSEASVSDEEAHKPATAKELLAALEVLKSFFNNFRNATI